MENIIKQNFFTSDTHYGHVNLCSGESVWVDKLSQCRQFDSVKDMNDAIVNNINDVVGENDILWHLGDFSLGKKENVNIFRERINCKNINLILGNHDQRISKDKELQKLFNSVSVGYGWPMFKDTKIQGTRLMMLHFPMMVWDNHKNGTIHLHGHCHGSLSDKSLTKRKIIDVGIDAHPNFRPFSLDEIIKIADQRTIDKVDHH